MKKKSLVKFTKRIMAGLLSVAMILTGILVVPKEVEAAAATKVCFASAEEYVMSDYWDGKDNKAPVKEGYVFGGWFKEADASTAGAELETGTNKYYVPMKEVEAADNTAVAKFVPAEVLSIKTQAALGDATSSLRILSTVDSLNYQEVGFEYKLGIKAEAQTGKGGLEKITKVYSAIKPHKDATSLLYPTNEFVKDVSKYFVAADVSTIVKDSYSKIVYARPFWVTMDGTEVMGLARNNRIIDKQNSNQYTSVGINLLPQLTKDENENKTLAAVAAGKIQVTYNTDNYDVVGTPDITTDATIGGTYLFSEMECHVNEAAGTITFVGNAIDTTADLLADGLFANVRFKKTTNATSDALDFTIETEVTDFCNWAEASVDTVVVQ